MSSNSNMRTSSDAKKPKVGKSKNVEKTKNVKNETKQEKKKHKHNHKEYFGKNEKPKTISKEIKTTNEVVTKEVLGSMRYGDARSNYGPKQAAQNNINIEYVSHGATVIVPLNDVAIISVAAALVSKALIKGLDATYAAPALQQIAEILKGAALNAEPVTLTVPGYLQVVSAALSPKTVLHKGAAFNYSWLSEGSDIAIMQQLPYGNTNNSGVINYGTVAPGSGSPLNLPVVIPGPPPTADQKKIAFSKFTSALAEGDNGTGKSLTPAEMKAIMRDTSAYAGQTIIDGFAIGGQGGTIVRLGSEAAINYPMFGRFATVQNSYRDYNRACNVNTEAGGGPMELGMFISQYRAFDLKKILKPVVKFVDFDSLMHVFLMTWIYAIGEYTSSPEFTTVASINGSEADKAVRNRCIPASFLEVQVALRNEFMKVFAETQFGVQSLGPTTDANEAWLGFSCGVGTTPNYQVSSMFMSGPFVENLRALSSTTVYDVKDVKMVNVLLAAKKTRKLTPQEQKMLDENQLFRPYLPVLGSYVNGGLNEADYTVTYNGGLVIPLFQPPVTNAVKKPEIPSSPSMNKKLLVKPGAKDNLAIRINDGSTGNGYVALNDPAIVGEIIDRINKIAIVNSKYFAGLRQNTVAPAANCLRQLGSNIFGVRNLDGSSDGSYLDNVKLNTITYGYYPEKAIEEQIRFVKGIHYASLTSGDGSMKSNNDRETEVIVVGGPNEQVSLRSYLNAVAKLGIADGTTSNVEKKLLALDAKGRGGIFSDIANALGPVSQVALPLAGGFLDSTFLF